MEKYISVVETAERWNVSPRRIQILCNENRIKGAKKQSGIWFIPYGAKKPERIKSGVKNEENKVLNVLSLFSGCGGMDLEFLGDAILDAVVADIVYKRFEGKREGFLTNTRSKIVQRETLNRLAIEIGLDKLIKYTARQSSHNSYMCGNAFEALVGAIYLDRGYRACKYFMEHRIIGPYINLEKISRKEVNFKSKLIEWSQKNRFEVTFELITQSHDQGYNPTFESEVLVEGISGGKGTGYSKKESQQMAARVALGKIKNDSGFIECIFAAKTARELPQEEVTVSDSKPSDSGTVTPDLSLEEIKKTDVVEQIISEAEEKAFKENA